MPEIQLSRAVGKEPISSSIVKGTLSVRTEHGSLKNRQSRSSGKVQSSISGKLLSPQKDVCIVSLDPITNVSTSSPVICLFRLI